MALIAISDIHGCYHSFRALLEKVKYNYKKDTLVLLGDYIDRGIHNLKTVEFLINLEHEVGPKRCMCLRGNHEQMAIDAQGCYDPLWVHNGGYSTGLEFAERPEKAELIVKWFTTLPLGYGLRPDELKEYSFSSDDKALAGLQDWKGSPKGLMFCHAGFANPLVSDNSAVDILWGREWIKTDKRPREMKVVFGHTPNLKGAYTTKTKDICIDSGGVFGGKFCALVLDNNGARLVYCDMDERDKLE